MVYFCSTSCLRYTILVGNPWFGLVVSDGDRGGDVGWGGGWIYSLLGAEREVEEGWGSGELGKEGGGMLAFMIWQTQFHKNLKKKAWDSAKCGLTEITIFSVWSVDRHLCLCSSLLSCIHAPCFVVCDGEVLRLFSGMGEFGNRPVNNSFSQKWHHTVYGDLCAIDSHILPSTSLHGIIPSSLYGIHIYTTIRYVTLHYCMVQVIASLCGISINVCDSV